MRIAVYCGHVGSDGLKPSGQHGGGELHTFAFLDILNKYYDVTAVVNNGIFPSFDLAGEYGLDLSRINWKPLGDTVDWLRQFDVLISINHGIMIPPIARRNILVTFFPQHPHWDVSGFDTIIANSNYTAKWIKAYWGREAETIYPPIELTNISEHMNGLVKQKLIACVGRFFEVPGGNNKNHMIVLNSFQQMMRPDFNLAFIGAVQNIEYYDKLRAAAGKDERIRFFHNLNRNDYLKIIGESTFIWAATGYESKSPSSKEHFGIFAVEGMAMGTIPIVYKSGGTPESGCLTWEQPDDLKSQTLELMNDFEALTQTSGQMIRRAQDFGMQAAEKRLIEVIEKPIAIVNEQNQFKIYLDDLKPHSVKVGMISDAPITTGFGTVTYSVSTELMKKGHRVAILGMQDPNLGKPRLTPEDLERIVRDEMKQVIDLDNNWKDAVTDNIMAKIRSIEPATIWRGCIHDLGGWENMGRFVINENPDVIYLNYDPGNVRSMIDTLRQLKIDKPLVAYLPIEGKPVIPQYIELLRLIRVLNGQTILYSKWSVDAVMEAGGPRCKYAYHGADHANFRVLPEEERQKLRYSVGWQNKTVLMAVGRNKRTKGFGTLIQVAKILKAEGHDQFRWYFHTNPNDMMRNSSMPLEQLAYVHGVQDVIMFAPDLENQTAGIPYDLPIHRGEVPDTDNIEDVWAYNLSTMSMIERFNLANIYVNATELEGFGLTPLEAMGCGLPVISIDDGGVIREVLGAAPIYVPSRHNDPSWHTGAMLSQADPRDIAKAIVDLSEDKNLQVELQQASLEQHKKYRWQDTAAIISSAILEQAL